MGLAVACAVVATLVFGCGPKEKKRPSEEHVATNAAAVVASVDVASFAVYADKSAALGEDTKVTGGAAGVRTVSSDVFSDGVELSVSEEASAPGALYADAVLLEDCTVGEVHTNKLIEKDKPKHGAVFPFDPAAMPALPTAGAVSPASGSFVVAKKTTVVLAPSAKGDVTISEKATLRLSGGIYHFGSLKLTSSARLEAAGASEVRIAGRLDAGEQSYLGPASGSGLTAKGLRIEVSGFNGGSKITSKPAACALGEESSLRALLLVPNGTLVLGEESSARGALFGAAVRLDEESTVTFEDGFAAAGCPASCDDGNACTADSCKNNACVHAPAANGTTCNDNNACTQQDSCQAGACVGASPVTCAAQDQCHAAGTCDPATGTCTNPAKPDGTSCSDGSACTQTDTCQAGACVGTNPVVCAALDQCHAAGTCDPASGVCSNPPAVDGTTCTDGNACTQTDVCVSGACSGANPVQCAALDQCHAAGACDPSSGVCSNPAKPNGTSCSDGNACTQTDSCQAGACVGTSPVTCAPLDQCHDAGTCDTATGVCSNPSKANGSACDDANACTQSDSCQSGTCTGASPVICTAQDQCHAAGTCNAATGVCSNPTKPNGTTCSDGNACTLTDACQAGTCTGASSVQCSALDQCHDAGTCDAATGVCSNPSKPDGASCNDGNACSQADKCLSGACVGSNPVLCKPLDQCHGLGTCDPAIGTCSNPPAPNGVPCNDGNLCTQGDTCQAGTCTGGAPIMCQSPDQCHNAGTCDPTTGQCANTPKSNGTPCNDGNLCTQSDACQFGTCIGSNPVTCAPPGQCQDAGTCNPATGTCTNAPKPNGTSCNDNSACTQTDQCQNGVCFGANPVQCTAQDQCHVLGVCNSATGLCSNPAKPNNVVCDDGNACTSLDTCQAGTCTAGSPVVCSALDPCHATGVCDVLTGQCSNPAKPNGTSCDDANACTINDACQAGTCAGTNSNLSCPASDQCHDAGTCDPSTGTCSNPAKPNGTTCDDGNACTKTDQCQAGTCAGSNAVQCTPLDQCHSPGVCDPANGTCSNPAKADGSTCDDGSLCTQTDTCQSGACTGSNPVQCNAPDQCHTSSCAAATGTCTTAAKADGASCATGKLCVQSEMCASGACGGGTQVDPDDANPCTIDACSETKGVTHRVTPGADCGSNMACTVTGGCVGIPQDPSSVAPAVDRTVATTIFASTSFLYSGAGPTQTDVAGGTIVPKRAAVVRGQVIRRGDGSPVVGAAVHVRGHTELGGTLSRSDGRFDLVVNGGGLLDITIEKPGLLPAQRRVDVPWQSYAVIDPVALVALDSQATTIGFQSPIEVATGSAVTDADGTRTPRIMFAGGTKATMVNADGTTTLLDSMKVRLTEYTVGSRGEAAMPLSLPPTSAYTYAVDLTADEVLDAGAKRVELDTPAYFYLDNFLAFPAGVAIPTGAADFDLGGWVPSPNGRVVKLLSITNGLADLDVDGSSQAADASALDALGFTNAERAKLATIYSVGDSVWRIPIKHFTPYDGNLDPDTDCGATACTPPTDGDCKGPDCEDADSRNTNDEDDCGCGSKKNSRILAGAQALGETIPVAGTPFSLNYRSNRVVGRTSSFELPIRLSGATVHPKLSGIELRVSIAGKHFFQNFPPNPNQSYTFTWDGTDIYGRALQGTQYAQVKISYLYPSGYAQPPATENSFGSYSPNAGGVKIAPARTAGSLQATWVMPIGTWTERESGLGGWSISARHAYDPIGKVLYLGDGTRRSTGTIGATIVTTAGGGNKFDLFPQSAEGSPATDLHLKAQQSVAARADGQVYFFDNDIIWRIDEKGSLRRVVGTGAPGYNGDEQLAINAEINAKLNRVGMGFDAKGNFYFADNLRIRKITTDGKIHTIAGNGLLADTGIGGPAMEVSIAPWGLAVAPDGTLYFSQGSGTSVARRVWRLSLDGRVMPIAGTGVKAGASAAIGDNGPALSAIFDDIQDVAVGPDGSVYVLENNPDINLARVRRITPDGVIHPAAGSGNTDFSLGFKVGNGGPATQADLYNARGIAVDAAGTLFIAEANGFADTVGSRLQAVASDGTIHSVAGRGVKDYDGDEGAATAAAATPRAVAIHPDGRILTVDHSGARLRDVKKPFAGYTNDAITIASRDAREVYVFSAEGRHLKTRDAVTGAALYTFGYDASGLLSTVTDVSGNVTTVARSPDGTPKSITAPFGQVTSLSVDAHGYLASVADAAGETSTFTYTDDGLMLTQTDPLSLTSKYSYDDKGRLITDTDPVPAKLGFTRSTTTQGSSTTLTSAEGRVTIYHRESEPTGDRKRKTTFASGLFASLDDNTDATRTTTVPNGDTITVRSTADPRFGMLAPVVTTTTKTPLGHQLTVALDRSVTLSDPNDTLSATAITESTTINGSAFKRVYDAATMTWTFTTPEGRKTTTKLDAAGRVVETTTAGLLAVSYAYDVNGRLTATSQGERTSTLGYDAAGWLGTATDSLLQTTLFGRDAVGRPTQVVRPDNKAIGQSFDAGGNPITVTPPGQPAHGFGYTPVDLLSSYGPPDVGFSPKDTSWAYNLDRQLTQMSRPDAQSLGYTYDTAGRLALLTAPTGTRTRTYSATTGVLDSIAAPGLTLSLGHDGHLLTSFTWSGAVNGSVEFAFDDKFEVVTETVNQTNAIMIGYDLDGLVKSSGDLAVSRSAQNALVTGTTLDAVIDTYSYSTFGELSGYQALAGANAIYEAALDRDKLGRITKKTETIGGATTVYEYGYDFAGRLTTAKVGGQLSATYSYDANGNRLSLTTPSGTTNGSYDAQDRLLTYGAVSFTYTPAGELATRGDAAKNETTTYTYDVFGNLTKVILPDGDVVEYLADPENRRVLKKVNGALERAWLYKDELRPIAELDAANNVVSRFVYALGKNVPDYVIKGGVKYRLITDQVGTVRLVVNAATGAVAQRLDYDEFGVVTSDTAPGFQPFGFAGGLYDPDTGLVRFGARDYDAATGRWTAKDPIGFAGGDTNIYAYVAQDPINSRDFTGLSKDPVCLDACERQFYFNLAACNIAIAGRGLRDCGLDPKCWLLAAAGAGACDIILSGLAARCISNCEERHDACREY